MKQRIKPVFTKRTTVKLLKQMRKAFDAYHKQREAYIKKGKNPDDVPAPKYLVTDGLKDHLDNFMIAWGEMEEIAIEQEKLWGKKATEIHDTLIEKMLGYVVDENAKAYGMLFVPNPAAVEAEVETEEDDDE